MKTIETKVYEYAELTDEAKEKAIESISDWNSVDFWYWFDDTIESTIENWLINQEYDYKPYIPKIDFKFCKWHFEPYICGNNDFTFNAFTIAISDLASIYKKDMTEREKLIFKLTDDYDIEVFKGSADYTDNYHKRTAKVISKYAEKFAEAINELEYQIFDDIISEIKYRNSEEYLIELAEANEIYFTEDGKIFS